jgi:betaine-aldehyde dehydrogenase
MSLTELQNFIDGRYVRPTSVDYEDLIDPCTGTVYAKAPTSGASEVDQAMRAAAAAFSEWRFSTPRERQQVLLAIAKALEDRMAEFATAEIQCTGSAAAASEIPVLVDQLRFFAGAARTMSGVAAGEYVDGCTSYVRREPVGVCAQLAPWNFPLLMTVLKSAPAIAAGNAVVLKPAATTPGTALMFAELAAPFLPRGVLNVLCGGDTTGQLMVSHPAPALISLTGSIQAGIDVASSAGSGLKRLHLELGGKTPVIVCADADLEAATRGIITGAFTNAGQDCTAASRVLATDQIYDELADRLATASSACKPGLPSDATARYGPLNSAGQLERVRGYLNRLPAHAKVLTGGHQAGKEGFFFEPTVVANVRGADEISRAEVFGPVITVERFSTDDEAVISANAVPHGLASAVWTASHARAMNLNRLLDFGCVWVNTHLRFPAELPHGGFKMSGYGKDLSVYGLEEYTRIKHVMHQF